MMEPVSTIDTQQPCLIPCPALLLRRRDCILQTYPCMIEIAKFMLRTCQHLQSLCTLACAEHGGFHLSPLTLRPPGLAKVSLATRAVPWQCW